jgi:integrase
MPGHVEKRGKDCWRIHVFLGTDANGNEIRHKEAFRGSKREADKRLTELLRERDLGNLTISPTKMTVAEYMEHWLEKAAKPKLADRTLEDYVDLTKRHIKKHIGNVPLAKLTPLAVQSFYSKLTESGLGAKSVRNVHVILHSALKQAIRWQMIMNNAAANVELPRGQKKEMAALDSVQAARFLEAADKFPKGIAYLVGLTGGMRPSEYLALKWTDMNLTSGEVRVQRSIFRPRGGGWKFQEPKTSRSRRTVILPQPILALLRKHREKQLAYIASFPDYHDLDLVFASETGEPLEQNNLNKRTFKKMLEAARLPSTIRPYDLRHSCATLLLEAGTNPKIVSERLGHASIVLTLDTYSHVTPTMQQEAANTLSDLLFSRPSLTQT